MTTTKLRDKVSQLAKSNEEEAAKIAETIDDAWFRSQAWAHVARWAAKPIPYARQAAMAASQGKDNYQRSAVRSWEIVALAERGLLAEAVSSLNEAVEIAATVEPMSSRSESLILLLQAAFKISLDHAITVQKVIEIACDSTHWRSIRAKKWSMELIEQSSPPREFFGKS